MRLLSIIKVIVVMIDARSEWNVKDGQTKFYEYYLKRKTDKLTEVLEIIEHFCTGHFNN